MGFVRKGEKLIVILKFQNTIFKAESIVIDDKKTKSAKIKNKKIKEEERRSSNKL